jgi:hypothetical protein
MTAPILPGERPTFRTVAPAPLLTAVLAGLAVAGAVYVTPASKRLAVACGRQPARCCCARPSRSPRTRTRRPGSPAAASRPSPWTRGGCCRNGPG